MKDYKVFKLLRTLNKTELSAFSKHLRQKHAGEHVAIPVFAYIRKAYPDFKDEKKLDIGHIHQKVFNEPVNTSEHHRKKILNAFADLYNWLKEFLLLEKIRTDRFEREALWLKILRTRNLEVEFVSRSENLTQELEKTGKKGGKIYLNDLLTRYDFYHHYAQGKVPPHEEVINAYNRQLDVFYTINKLKLVCEMVNIGNQFSIAFDVGVRLRMLEQAYTAFFDDHPLVRIYHKLLYLIRDSDSENFAEVETLLSRYTDQIDPEEIHVILSYLQNYAAHQIRLGKEEFWEQIHRLNKFGLEYRIFTREGVMSPTQFGNIVNIGCKVKDFGWIKKFINTQKQFLDEGTREFTVSLAKANLLIGQGEFKKALSDLRAVVEKDIRQSIRKKSYELICHYELFEDENTIYDYLAAFEAYLRRNQFPEKKIVEATMNYIRMVKKLVRKKMEKDRLIKEITDASNIYFREWLLKKAASYKAIYATRKRRF